MPAVFLRGLTNLLYDLCENPEGLKELLAMISRGHLEKLDYLESNNLLSLNNDSTYVGSGGFGLHRRAARQGFQRPGALPDLWGFTESQETVGVSPEMYEEFIFPCEKPIMDRFGLTCYGCCEPVHGRWQVVKRHHHLRRVSCSPWADLEKMADYLQDRYILSYKPNPAALAVPQIDEPAIRAGLRRALDSHAGLRRGSDHEGQPHPGRAAGKRRPLVPDRQRRGRKELSMKLGVDSYSTRNCGLDAAGVLELAGDLGLQGVLFELSPFSSFRDAELESSARPPERTRPVRGVGHGLDLPLASHGGQGPRAAGRGRLRRQRLRRPDRHRAPAGCPEAGLAVPAVRGRQPLHPRRRPRHDRPGRPGRGHPPRGLPRPPRDWA